MKRVARRAVRAFAVTGLVALALPACTVARDGRESTRPQFVPAAGSPVAVGPMPNNPKVADINGDGNLDVVLTCGGTTDGKPDPKNGSVAVLAGDGRGGFALAQPLIPIGADGLKAAVGDVNGDKRPDIVVVAHDHYTVTVLLQDERGRFDAERKRTLQASQGGRPHTHDVALADVNADGNLDVLTTNADDNNVSALLGDGTGRFEPAKGSPFAAGHHPYQGLSLGDLNGDKKLDVVVPNIHGDAVSILLGDGAGAFAAGPGSPVAVGDRPGVVALGELTGDANTDIVATHDDEPIVYVLRGDGRGGFRPTDGSPLRLKETAWGAAVADVNADGRNDLVLGGRKGHVLLLMGDGAGGFDGDPTPVPVGGQAPSYVEAADVNRDGKLDLLTSNYESGDVSVLLQR